MLYKGSAKVLREAVEKEIQAVTDEQRFRYILHQILGGMPENDPISGIKKIQTTKIDPNSAKPYNGVIKPLFKEEKKLVADLKKTGMILFEVCVWTDVQLEIKPVLNSKDLLKIAKKSK